MTTSSNGAAPSGVVGPGDEEAGIAMLANDTLPEVFRADAQDALAPGAQKRDV